MQEITIRDASSDDITEILEVTERAWNAAYSDILSQPAIDATMTELRESDAPRRFINRDKGVYFVAEHHDELVGYISGGPSDEENVAILGALYVDPEYWNNGIGTALLTKFEAFCGQHDYDAVRFQVLSENEIGMSFYRRHRYTVVNEQKTDRFDEPAIEATFQGPVE